MHVLILGCGWIGNIFAEKLLAESPHKIFASTTSSDKAIQLNKIGIHSAVINFNEPIFPGKELATNSFDLVLISVPAKKKEEHTACMEKFKRLANFLQKIKYHHAIYLSSTGIYPQAETTIAEDNIPDEMLDKKLYGAEKILSSSLMRLTILRLGGIFGYDRVPGKHFSEKTCSVGYQYANYIHADDIINVILSIYRSGITNEILNVVSPHHPIKKDIILRMAHKYHFPLPSSFLAATEKQKVISSEKLIRILNYQFLYPSPLDY
ncbi:hypothetical protein H8S90_23325 [Olivibacter sp. SDN3]|uniref:hypothetical protein n=1 Tax=Olivibacter sp. SDN3 TaxID=2764720 RepID=UPI0016511D34|nr:hypothetical protein [Olivibacter sp. SDN3]QNL49618.1 hypothetical protein H8S90_23325 [Olivibacter sp. SDN3]